MQLSKNAVASAGWELLYKYVKDWSWGFKYRYWDCSNKEHN